MTDHPVTRYKEDFFIHLQSVFSRTDAYEDNKKPHRPLLETKLLKTQVQYQGNSAWLKRNKQEIQSLKTTITQHFHLNSLTASWLLQHTKDLSCIGCLFLGLQLKQLYAQITHKYRAPLSSTPHTRNHSKRHLVPSQLVWCSQREPHIKPGVYQIIRTHYCLVKALTTRNSLPLANKLSIKFQCD